MKRIEMGSNKFTPAQFERAKQLCYSEEETLTAMCIWEEALCNDNLMAWLKGNEGACMARSNALHLVDMMEHMYKVAVEKHDYGDVFDWEFVPDCCTEILKQAPRFADLEQVNQAEVIAFAIKVFD